jgi:hypothetical protein
MFIRVVTMSRLEKKVGSFFIAKTACPDAEIVDGRRPNTSCAGVALGLSFD